MKLIIRKNVILDTPYDKHKCTYEKRINVNIEPDVLVSNKDEFLIDDEHEINYFDIECRNFNADVITWVHDSKITDIFYNKEELSKCCLYNPETNKIIFDPNTLHYGLVCRGEYVYFGRYIEKHTEIKSEETYIKENYNSLFRFLFASECVELYNNYVKVNNNKLNKAIMALDLEWKNLSDHQFILAGKLRKQFNENCEKLVNKKWKLIDDSPQSV
jgi:hypothetical protein